jgi:hypothetical protein
MPDGQQPIFAENRTKLLQRLQLGSITTEDAEAAVDAALAAVAIGVYDRLGSGTTDTIRGYTYSDDPSTSVESRTRLKGAVLEEKWVRYELLRTMPSVFPTSSNRLRTRINEASAYSQDPAAVADELERLWAEISELLDDLAGNDEAGSVSARTFGPDTTPVYEPGGSVRSYLSGS